MNRWKRHSSVFGRTMAWTLCAAMLTGNVLGGQQAYAAEPDGATNVPGIGADAEPGSGDADANTGTGNEVKEPGTGSEEVNPGADDTDKAPGAGDADKEPGTGDGDTSPGANNTDKEPGTGSETPGTGADDATDNSGNGTPGAGNTTTNPGTGEGNGTSGAGDMTTNPGTGDDINPGTGSGNSASKPGTEQNTANGAQNVTGGALNSMTPEAIGAMLSMAREGDYTSFVTDELIGELKFGTDIKASNVYEDGKMGFQDITWPNDAQGWVSNVYYPREVAIAPGAAFVADGEGYLAIKSKVWTETESSGYGVFTYEETTGFEMAVANADYSVEVTFVNPGDAEYTAYLEAEDVTKVTDIKVGPRATVTKELTAVVVDGGLSLKFLAPNSATSKTSAAEKTVYVSNVKVTRLATNGAGDKPTVYLASDSTVQTYDDFYDPQTGWGETLGEFFGGITGVSNAAGCGYKEARVYDTPNVTVENRAIGGRSSKSFIDEGKLDDLLDDIRPGDYLFVQWGHNDATAVRPNRYVSPADFEKWIQYYIDGALQRGATPVLVTPVARYSYKTDASGKLESFNYDFAQYRDVMLKMSNDQGIALVDLSKRSIEVCNSFGIEGAKSLFLHVQKGEYPGGNYANGVTDNTHLQYYGAYKFAQCVAKGIQECAALSELASKVDIQVSGTAPAKITGFTNTSVGAVSVALSWDKAEGAELYYIYRQALNDGETADSVDFTNAEKYSVSSKVGYTDNGCQPGVTYVYAVRGFNEVGLGEFSDKITVSTKDAGWRFDFNYKGSATLDGWIGINHDNKYDAALGYGFTKTPGNGRDRAGNKLPDGTGPLAAMANDFVLGDSVFEVVVPNGTYEVTGYAADLLDSGSTIKSTFTAEGSGIGTIAAKQSLGSLTATVQVTDGKLTIGNSGYMTGLTVTSVLAAPSNVRCTSPTEDVEELQRSVTIEWDAVAAVTGQDGKTYDVILYNIYRSDKAEGDKGFKEFVKVATVEGTLSFEDDTVVTNVPYYYKVTAVNAGGEGEMSEVCKTPVTGKLIAGGRERYTDRGLVAINLAGGKGAETLISATGPNGEELTKGVYLSWRAFESDMSGKNQINTTFDVYRDGTKIAGPVKVTNMVDEAGTADSVYKVVGSNDSTIGVNSVDTKCWANQYLELGLFSPADETMPDGSTCSFSANDMSVGDLDGDGQLELIVKWYPSNAQDNSKSGYTGNTYLDGYDINWATGDVKLMWRINLGVNIRSGAHYTQFQVWDYDGDGRAEIAVKTGDGTTTYKSTDGTAAGLERTGYVGEASDETLTISENHGKDKFDYRAGDGYVIIPEGHEYFSIFNGEDGSKAADDVPYEPFGGNATAWGDNSNGYRNRIDRFLSATAYLDGETPYAVFCRGYYTRTCLTAYYMKDTDGDNVGDTIDILWKFDTKEAGSQYEAQGNHGLSVNDVDNDGKDEIIYGSLTVDHDGTVLYSTNLGHGDAMHVSDWVSWNPGLEIMAVHEHDDAKYHVEIHDAETGKVLMGYEVGRDTGRGVAADIDPTAEGAEWWAIASPFMESGGEPSWDSTNGAVFSTWSTLDKFVTLSGSKTPASNFSIFWDGDLLSEIQDHSFNNKAYAPIGVVISKWNWEENKEERLLYSEEIWSSNGTKGNLGLVADILGDWREEIIARSAADPNKVRVYSTTIQTDYVVPCLLENLAYREGVAWQNVGYNQPANLSYLLSEGLVTAQLSEGKVEAESAEVNFTEANDGTYGHKITGYEIYRKLTEGEGEYELIDTLTLDQLIESGGNSGDDTTNPEPGESEPSVKKEVLFKADFEDGTQGDFAPVTNDRVDCVKVEADSVTSNPNTSKFIYGVGGGAGDVDVQSKSLAITENVTVELDLRMDATARTKKSHIALLGTGNEATTNWLDCAEQILTIEAVGGSKDKTWGKITINGVDITEKANKGTKTEGKSDQTTGWLRLSAKLDFTTHTVEVTLTRISSGEVVYEGVVDFVNKDVNVLDRIFMASNKAPGYVFMDNVEVYKEVEVNDSVGGGDDSNQPSGTKTYVYTDKGLTPVTKYSYKVAAIVDGKTSFMSKALEIETADKIVAVEPLEPIELVEGTPVEDGETAASLLTQTVQVTTEAGEKKEYTVKWDITGFDINQKGEYTVTGSIKGWADPITLKVTVVANAMKGYVPFKDVRVVVGQTVTLPEMVEVEWTNGTTTTKSITWDMSKLDINTKGEYELTATVADSTDTVNIKVLVVDDYVNSVPKAYGEVVYLSKDVEAQLPATIPVVYVAGGAKEAPVTWKPESVSTIDTSKAGMYPIVGTIEGFDGDVEAEITVVYDPVYKFDFGIKTNEVADGWIGITVNAKGKKQTADALGISYNAEKGYGFLNGNAVIEGRSENYDQAGLLPKIVYRDFVLPSEQIFGVDLPNGKYQVEIVSGSELKSDIKGNVEGVDIAVGNAAKTYTVKTVEVDMEDGQMTFEFTKNTSRVDCIVIRLVEADKTALKAAIDGADALADSEALYTPETWEAFQAALTEAKKVYDDIYPDCATVEAARTALIAAQEALEEKTEEPGPDVDKTALQEAVDAAKALADSEQLYTEESWAAFMGKLEEAQTVLDREDATAVEVEAARVELLAAQEALVKKPEEVTITGVVTPEVEDVTEGITLDELMKKLPAEVEVTYSDGTTGKETATWDVSKVDLNKAGVYNAYVTIEGWSDSILCKITVKSVEVTITGVISPEVEDLTVGMSEAAFVEKLPAEVEVTYSDGTTGMKTAVWDISKVDLGKAGVYDAYITVEGWSESVVCKITVKSADVTITGVISPKVEAMTEGMTLDELMKKLPTVVEVTYSDGTTGTKKATWDVSKVDLNKAGVYDAYVKVQGWNEPVLCKITVTEKVTGSSDVSMEVKPSEGVPEIGVPEVSEEKLKEFLEEEDIKKLEEGKEVKLVIEAEAKKDEDIPASVLAELNAKVSENGLKVALKLNINLMKYITGEAPKQIAEAKSEVILTITIPEEVRVAPEGYSREFFIVRTHEKEDGSVLTDILTDRDNDDTTITIGTDKFSVYALSYKDTLINTDDNKPGEDTDQNKPDDGDTNDSDDEDTDDEQESVDSSSHPKTGDQTNIWVWVILLTVALAGIAALFGVKMYRKKDQ